MAAGTFGHELLFPGTAPVDPRRFRRLPPPMNILSEPELPAMRTASLAPQRPECVYKPVMSDADIEACR